MAKAEKQAVPAVGNKAILAEVTLIDAIKQIESKLAYQPESVRFAQLADAYLDMGQYDQAITILTDGLQKFPYYDTARLILAKAYYRRGEKKQAQEYIREFLQSHPAHVAAHKLLGDLALEEDDVVSAVQKYRVALRFDPINKALIQSLVDLKDQYQKLKASRSEEEDEDGVRPVVRKPVSSAERPAPTAETPAAKAQPSFEPPAEKEELKMPTEMVEDLIVKEMTKKKTVPVAEEVKPEPLAEPVLEEKRDELISDSASEVPTTVTQTATETSDVDEALKASAAWVDSEGILYFYDDEEVSFAEFKQRQELKKAGRAAIMDRAALDKKIAAAGGAVKKQVAPENPKEKTEEIRAKIETPAVKEVPTAPSVKKEIPKPEEKPASQPKVVKRPPERKADDYKHEVHKDDTIHRHVDSAFGSGEDTGVFITPEQETAFFEKASAEDNEVVPYSEVADQDILTAEEQEAALDDLEMSYKDYLDVLTDEADLEESLFKDDEEESVVADDETDAITERLAKVQAASDDDFIDEEDAPMSYSDYLERVESDEEHHEALLDDDNEVMRFAAFAEWLDTCDDTIDYATYQMMEGLEEQTPKNVASTESVITDEEPAISYAAYVVGLSDEAERTEARLDAVTEEVPKAAQPAAIIPEKTEEKPAPEIKAVEEPVKQPEMPQTEAFVTELKQIDTPKAETKALVAEAPPRVPVVQETPKPVVEAVKEETAKSVAVATAEEEAEVVTEEVEITEEDINPQDATMEMVEKFAQAGQFGMSYKVCKMLKMKNPTDAKVDRKVLELKRLYLWSSQLVG